MTNVGDDVGMPRLALVVPLKGGERIIGTEDNNLTSVIDVQQVNVASWVKERNRVRTRSREVVLGGTQVGEGRCSSRALGEIRQVICLRAKRHYSFSAIADGVRTAEHCVGT